MGTVRVRYTGDEDARIVSTAEMGLADDSPDFATELAWDQDNGHTLTLDEATAAEVLLLDDFERIDDDEPDA